MNIGLYAYKTFGKKETDAAEGLMKILGDDSLCLDILIAPEYTNISLEDAKLLSSIDEEVLLIPGTTLVQEGNKIFNRTHILKDEKVLHQYDKINGCLRPGYCDSEHFPGSRPSNVTFGGRGEKALIFDYLNKKIGIEICRDHDSNVLKNALNGKDLDMQILISAGMCGIRRNAVKPSGYALHVDGGMDEGSDHRHEPIAQVYGNKKIQPIRMIPIITGKNREENILSVYNLK